jgi:hypothetical protein
MLLLTCQTTTRTAWQSWAPNETCAYQSYAIIERNCYLSVLHYAKFLAYSYLLYYIITAPQLQLHQTLSFSFFFSLSSMSFAALFFTYPYPLP